METGNLETREIEFLSSGDGSVDGAIAGRADKKEGPSCVDGNLGGVEGRGKCQAGSEVGPKEEASTCVSGNRSGQEGDAIELIS